MKFPIFVSHLDFYKRKSVYDSIPFFLCMVSNFIVQKFVAISMGILHCFSRYNCFSDSAIVDFQFGTFKLTSFNFPPYRREETG